MHAGTPGSVRKIMRVFGEVQSVFSQNHSSHSIEQTLDIHKRECPLID